MTDKQTYWLADDTGKKALVTGKEQRDRWVPLGWADTTEPTGSEFFYAWLEGVEVPGVFPALSRDVWEAKGWKPGPPPEPVNPFNSEQLPAPAAAPLDAPAATTPKLSTPAAGGDPKEK